MPQPGRWSKTARRYIKTRQQENNHYLRQAERLAQMTDKQAREWVRRHRNDPPTREH